MTNLLFEHETSEQKDLFADVFESILQEDASSEPAQKVYTFDNIDQNLNFLESFADSFRKIEEMTAKRDAGELYTVRSKEEPMQTTEPSTAKQDFSFTLSASEIGYDDKNLIHFNSIKYRRVRLDLKKFVKIIKQGYCFTSIFKQERFCVKQKNEVNWLASQFVVFDVDDIYDGTTLQEYLSFLKMKPTVAYTSRNHGLVKRGDNKPFSRYRLVYLFDDYIQSKEHYQSIYREIESDFPPFYKDPDGKHDNCGASPVQQFSGNSFANCEVIINEKAIYSTANFKPSTELRKSQESSKKTSTVQKPSTQNNLLNELFLNDLNSMKPVDFIKKYINVYGIIERSQLNFVDGYCETTEDYVEIIRNYRKVFDEKEQGYKLKRQRIQRGERHKKLFSYAKIRCQIKPDISLEELVFNAVYDRTYFCNTTCDNEMSNKCLINICQDAMKATYTMRMKNRPKFKIDKNYCLAHGLTTKQMQNYIRRKQNFDLIAKWYDPNKTIAANLRYAEENGIKVCRRTLSTFKKDRIIQDRKQNPQKQPEQPSGLHKATAGLVQKEAKGDATRTDTLANTDFMEYQKNCKLCNTTFGSEIPLFTDSPLYE